MPKRTGSNKLKKARSGGPRRARQGSQDGAASSAKLSGAASSRRDSRDDETRPERRLRDEDRSSAPPSQASASTRSLSIMERFQALPDTTRYGVMFAVCVAVAVVLYFAFTGGSTPSVTKAPAASSQVPVIPSGPTLLPSAMVPASPLAPSGPALLPPAAINPAAPALIPAQPAPAAEPKGKVPATAGPTPQPKGPVLAPPPAAQPQPKAPAPAAPGPGGDNPY